MAIDQTIDSVTSTVSVDSIRGAGQGALGGVDQIDRLYFHRLRLAGMKLGLAALTSAVLITPVWSSLTSDGDTATIMTRCTQVVAETGDGLNDVVIKGYSELGVDPSEYDLRKAVFDTAQINNGLGSSEVLRVGDVVGVCF